MVDRGHLWPGVEPWPCCGRGDTELPTQRRLFFVIFCKTAVVRKSTHCVDAKRNVVCSVSELLLAERSLNALHFASWAQLSNGGLRFWALKHNFVQRSYINWTI